MKRSDEVGELANAFNRMIVDLKGTMVSRDKYAQEVEERKKVEEQLKEVMAIKSKFTSVVSHELRTPLTAIKEGIGIVLDGSAGEINEDQRDFLDTAKRNVDRLHRLINDILDFTKLESGRMEFRMKENDINQVIKDVVEVQKTPAEAKGLYLKMEPFPEMRKVTFDYDRIVQVITNLVNNAIKFTEKGGITIRSLREDQWIRVEVKDTGMGIKEEDIPKLFASFQQVGESTYHRTDSTGLGLAICKEIIEAHQGRILVESVYGEGSSFIFTLPERRRENA